MNNANQRHAIYLCWPIEHCGIAANSDICATKKESLNLNIVGVLVSGTHLR